MTRRLQIAVGFAALAVIAGSLALLGWWRVQDAREFSRRYKVQAYGGTNYVIQLLDATVGKVESGYVVIVNARYENPNSSEVVLTRNMFILTDQEKDYFLPSTTGTQTPLIKLPPNGVLEKEALSFAVPHEALNGTLALQIGHQYFVVIKSEKPYQHRLRDGQFVTFCRRDW